MKLHIAGTPRIILWVVVFGGVVSLLPNIPYIPAFWANLFVKQEAVLPQKVSFAKVSPDGRYLAILSYMDEKITLRDLRQDKAIVVGTATHDVMFSQTLWSPSGKYLLYQDERQRWVALDAEKAEKVILPAADVVGWTQSDEWMWFSRKSAPSFAAPIRGSGTPQEILPSKVEPLVVNMDPSGQTLGWNSSTKTAVGRTGIDGELTSVWSGNPEPIAVSGNGRHMVVRSQSRAPALIDINAGHISTKPLNIGTGYQYFIGKWSPDGSQLALFCAIPGSGFDFFVISQDGRILYRTNLAYKYGIEDYTTWWSPDGASFGFVTYHLPVETSKTGTMFVYTASTRKLSHWTLPNEDSLEFVQWADKRTVYALSKDILYKFQVR